MKSTWRELEVGRVGGVVKHVRFDCTCGERVRFDCTSEKFRRGADYICECGRTYTVKKRRETVRI